MNWFERLIAPEIMERHALPLVVAFGCGVLAYDIANEYREVRAIDVAARAVAVAETYRDVCGPLWPPEEIPELSPQMLVRLQALQP